MSPTGSKMFDEESKSEIFADTMFAQFSTNPWPELEEVNNIILELENIQSLFYGLCLSQISVGNPPNLFLAKPPGLDNITNKAFKHLPKSSITLKANIYISYFCIAYFPNC